jgi:hypothetical protein
VVVYPSLCFHETNLAICYEGAACMNFWRAGLALSHRPDAMPLAPLGCVIVAWISQRTGGGYRHPLRIFYLSCLRPDGIDGFDYPGKDDHGTLVDPSSVVPGVPHCERATDFRRRVDGPRLTRRNTLSSYLAGHKQHWQRYAEQHGFVLPDHRETWDGSRIPF